MIHANNILTHVTFAVILPQNVVQTYCELFVILLSTFYRYEC